MEFSTFSKKRATLAGPALLILLALTFPAVASAAPLATTLGATEVAKETALLNGLVNPKGFPTTFYFEYGTTESYGSKSSETSAGFGNTPKEVSKSISGLTKSTLYHFRIVAKNFTGTTFGEDMTFTTEPVLAKTEPATQIFSKDATLNGKVNAEGSGYFYFEYGTTAAYGSETSVTWNFGSELEDVSSIANGLSPGTTYHFRIVAYSYSGGSTRFGADETFTTAGHTWYPQTTPKPAESSYHFEGISCVSGSECIAIGDYPMAAKWNGSEWSLMSIPGSGELNDVSCSSFTACMAVGRTWAGSYYAPMVERWNGSEWKIQEVPSPAGAKSASLYGVSCTSSTHCVAVGSYWGGGEPDTWPLAMVWNGTEWKLQEVPAPIGKGVNYLYDISCFSSSACTAVGYSSMDPLAVRWNGTEWKVQTTPEPGGYFESVSCPSSTVCVAVGLETKYEPGAGVPYAASWNGSNWSAHSVPLPSGHEKGIFPGVSCSSTTACSAVGASWDEEGAERSYLLAETWDGTSWQIQPVAEPSGSEDAGFKDVTCLSAFLCEAVGGYSKSLSSHLLASRFE